MTEGKTVQCPVASRNSKATFDVFDLCFHKTFLLLMDWSYGSISYFRRFSELILYSALMLEEPSAISKNFGVSLARTLLRKFVHLLFRLYEFLVFIAPLVSSASTTSSSLAFYSTSDCGTFYFNILWFYLPAVIIYILYLLLCFILIYY